MKINTGGHFSFDGQGHEFPSATAEHAELHLQSSGVAGRAVLDTRCGASPEPYRPWGADILRATDVGPKTLDVRLALIVLCFRDSRRGK